MKTLIIISASLLFALGNVVAQPKYTNPSYSSSNYKMPANAKIAKDLNLDKTHSYDYKAAENSGIQSSDNYKNSFAKAEDKGGIMPVLPVENENAMANNGNYKMQFKATRKAKKVDVEPVKEEPLVLKQSDEK